MLYITKFKDDPMDFSMGISAKIIKAPNGDFDGDELNMTLLLDSVLEEEYEVLSPHYNIPDLSNPYAVSGNLTLLGPANAILLNYLRDKMEDPMTDSIVEKLNLINLE